MNNGYKMKRKKLICILLAAAAILCAVIFRKPVYSEPPELTVRSGEETLAVPGSATSWTYKQGGRWNSYETSLKPVNSQGEYPELAGESKTAKLEFEYEPDRLRVSRYWISQTEIVEVSWRVDGNEVELASGNYFYEVTANWSREDRKWGGSATYYFRAAG